MAKTSKIITWLVVIIIVVGGIIWLSLSQKTENKEPIKIGYIGPLTGPLANPGVYIKNSFELGNKQYGLIGDREIKVLYEDGKCIPKEGVTAAEKFLNVDNVDIVVSAICGGSTLAIAPLTEEKEKVLISAVTSAPAVSEAGDFVFRISSSADLFAEKTASMITNLDYNKIGIVAENTDYAIGWKDAFVDTFDGTVTVVENFNTGDTDVKTQLLKVKDKAPDAILFLVQSPISAATLVKQAKELNIGTQLIGNEAFFARAVVKGLMGDAANGLLVVTYKYDLGSKDMEKFMADYEVAYNEKIPEEMYGALGYDTYMVLYEAMKKCKKMDSECLQKYLYSVNNKKGTSGTFSIDEKGDGIRDFMWWKVENSELIPFN